MISIKKAQYDHLEAILSLVKFIEFYSKLFVEIPRLHFTLNLRDQLIGNQVGHFGFQVESR